MKADLHLHTYYSDGTESPAELLERAASLQFDVVAVTDHDTIEGISEALETGHRLGIQVVPGVEITASFHDQELHLLAYFCPESGKDLGWNATELIQQLEQHIQHRLERVKKMVQRLNTLGISIAIEDVLEQTTSRTNSGGAPPKTVALGRPHVAAALVARKHVSSIDKAFTEFLKKGRPAWVDKKRADAREVINLIHRLKGIVILAHPGLLHDEKISIQLLEEGIDGVEVYHTRHTLHELVHYRNLAQDHGLLITGGSDCHGMLKGQPLMGKVELNGEDLERFLTRLDAVGIRDLQ